MKATTVHGKPAVKLVGGNYRGSRGNLFKLMDDGRTQQAIVILTTGAHVTVKSADWVYVR